MRSVFIVGAKRTPFGAFGGKLKQYSATQLAVEASKAALASAHIDPSYVDSVTVGNVQQSSLDAAYLARHVQLKCGIPEDKPALTINRLCGSGFQAIITGMQEIQLQEAEVTLCAGTENMSQAPLAVFGQDARFGTRLGSGLNLKDTLWAALTDTHAKIAMGETAEKLGSQYNITRQECDEYAARSQKLWQEANEAGYFRDEIAPITISSKKGEELFEVDEPPRLTSVEKLATLKPVFKKDGLVTAGNASGISDGAGSVVLASEEAVNKYQLQPLAKILAYDIAGVDPTIMGIGPVPAIERSLKKAGLSKEDIDLFEINEAFAAQTLPCIKELGLDLSKVNTCGGAIALGHPLGASGSRIMCHLVSMLHSQHKKYAVGSACIGGGQGIALVLESV